MSDQVTFTDHEEAIAIKYVQDLGGTWRHGTAEMYLRLKKSEEKNKELKKALELLWGRVQESREVGFICGSWSGEPFTSDVVKKALE